MHSRAKHKEIRHHFIRDHVLKGDCVIELVDTTNQLAKIFTKPLLRDRFYVMSFITITTHNKKYTLKFP